MRQVKSVTTSYERPELRIRTRTQVINNDLQLSDASHEAVANFGHLRPSPPSSTTDLSLQAQASPHPLTEADESPVSATLPQPSWSESQLPPHACHQPVQEPFHPLAPLGPAFINPFTSGPLSSWTPLPIVPMTPAHGSLDMARQYEQRKQPHHFDCALHRPCPTTPAFVTSVCPLALSWEPPVASFYYSPRQSHASPLSCDNTREPSLTTEGPSWPQTKLMSYGPLSRHHVPFPTPRSNSGSPTCLSPITAAPLQPRTSYFPLQPLPHSPVTQVDSDQSTYLDHSLAPRDSSLDMTHQGSLTSLVRSGLQHFAEGLQLDIGRPRHSGFTIQHSLDGNDYDPPVVYNTGGDLCPISVEDDLKQAATKIMQRQDLSPRNQQNYGNCALQSQDPRLLPSLMPHDGLCTPPELVTAADLAFALPCPELTQVGFSETCSPPFTDQNGFIGW